MPGLKGACPLEPWHSPAWSGEVTGDVSDLYGPVPEKPEEGLPPKLIYALGALALVVALGLAEKGHKQLKKPLPAPPPPPGKKYKKKPKVVKPAYKPYEPDVDPYRPDKVPPPFVWPEPLTIPGPGPKLPSPKPQPVPVGGLKWVELAKAWQVPVTAPKIATALNLGPMPVTAPPKLSYADSPDLPTVGITVPKPSPTLSVSPLPWLSPDLEPVAAAAEMQLATGLWQELSTLTDKWEPAKQPTIYEFGGLPTLVIFGIAATAAVGGAVAFGAMSGYFFQSSPGELTPEGAW